MDAAVSEEEEMLIENYDLEVSTPPCEPGAERFSVIARLVTDQPTCYTFALKLTMGQVKLEDCPALREAEYAAQPAQLVSMLAVGMPASGRKG